MSSSLTGKHIQDPHENEADASLEILSPEWCAPGVLFRFSSSNHLIMNLVSSSPPLRDPLGSTTDKVIMTQLYMVGQASLNNRMSSVLAGGPRHS